MISTRARFKPVSSNSLLSALLLLVLATPLLAALPVAVEKLPSLAPMLERATAAVVNIATRGNHANASNWACRETPFSGAISNYRASSVLNTSRS